MRKNLLIGLINLTLILAAGSASYAAQTAVTGEWTADAQKDKTEKIYISFSRRTESGGKNQNGTTYAYEDLQGLSRAETQNGRVSFKLVREAGTIECEGTFTNGKGVGTFRFTGNQALSTR